MALRVSNPLAPALSRRRAVLAAGRCLLVFLVLTLLLVPGAAADELIMRNGSRLIGEVGSKENGTLGFKTSFAGTINVKWSEVSELRLDEPIKIMLANEEIIWARVIRNTNETTTTVELEPGEPPRNYAPSELAYINPEPWRDGEGYNFSGRVNFAFERERGNTDKDEIDFDGDLEWRWKRDRVTAVGELEKDRDNNRRTTDKWDFTGKYDHFFTEKWYYGGVGLLESDKQADLNLRSGIGPLLGHQFFESRALNLSTEIGLLRINEDFKNQSDNNYWAAGWSIDFDKYLFADIMQFYHRNNGLWNLESTNDVVVNTWTGLRFPLIAGFVASTEFKTEYDSGAAKDADELDTTYRFKLGYEW